MAYIGRPVEYGNAVTQQITGAARPDYTLTYNTNTDAVAISLDGVVQVNGTDFNIVDTALTFTSDVASGIKINVIYIGLTLSIGTPGDNTVTNAKMANNSVDSAEIVAGAVDDAHISGMAASKLTGTIDNARISLDAAEIPNLDTAKITSGTFADARISEASVTQHVTPFDPAQLEMNMAILAFKVASANQLAKFSMVDQVIDEYQDATGIDAGNSTNELAGGATTSKYYEGGTSTTPTVSHDADATGTDSGYTWYKWTDTSSTGSFSINAAQTIEYLIVAGGGSGGRSNSGGGGAGGLIATTGVSYPSGTPTWTVTVGAGGAGTTSGAGNNGSNSVLSGTGLTTQTAIGGGAGSNNGIGSVGGSGGGNAHSDTSTPAAGTAGQGNSGGNVSGSHSGGGTAAPQYGCGGGGGAGAAGGTGTDSNGGAGGVGLQNDITGTNLYYAGGGGGSTNYSSAAAGAGGNGGGGSGGGNDGLRTLADADGDDNTGGGGGAYYVGQSRSGAGGSGVVIIRRSTSIESPGGNLTLQSVATAAESAPTTADLVMLIEDSGSGTASINTDIKAKVSRDGSAFSGYVTLVDEGDWGTDKRILVARNIDISGIASGTAMKYKIETFNQSAGVKETRIHATSLAWA